MRQCLKMGRRVRDPRYCEKRIKEHDRDCAARDILKRRVCPYFRDTLIDVLIKRVNDVVDEQYHGGIK